VGLGVLVGVRMCVCGREDCCVFVCLGVFGVGRALPGMLAHNILILKNH